MTLKNRKTVDTEEGALQQATQQFVASMLQAGGQQLNNLNGLLTAGELYPENTELAKLSSNLIALGNDTNIDAVKESAEISTRIPRCF
jgi:hypothetical protein